MPAAACSQIETFISFEENSSIVSKPPQTETAPRTALFPWMQCDLTVGLVAHHRHALAIGIDGVGFFAMDRVIADEQGFIIEAQRHDKADELE